MKQVARNSNICRLFNELTLQGELPMDAKRIIAERFNVTIRRIEQIIQTAQVEEVQEAEAPAQGFVAPSPTLCAVCAFYRQTEPGFVCLNCARPFISPTINNDVDDDDFLEIAPFLTQETTTKQETDFTPETSTDYEIKPSPVRDFKTFTENDKYDLTKNERWLILPDMQIPYIDHKSLDAVLTYASENYYHGVIQLGDYMDWDFISRWTKENARKIEGQRFLQEYIHGNAILDRILESVRKQNSDATVIIIEGNHDYRIENAINQTPALEGLIEMEKNLQMQERGITYHRYWTHRKPFIVGKAWFIHGEYLGTNHAKKTADSFGRNVFYGHTHDVMSYTKTTAWGDSVMCASLGTLSIMDLEYMGHRPSNWQQAFAEFFFNADGSFNHYVTHIINHSFVAINGRKYGS